MSKPRVPRRASVSSWTSETRAGWSSGLRRVSNMAPVSPGHIRWLLLKDGRFQVGAAERRASPTQVYSPAPGVEKGKVLGGPFRRAVAVSSQPRSRADGARPCRGAKAKSEADGENPGASMRAPRGAFCRSQRGPSGPTGSVAPGVRGALFFTGGGQMTLASARRQIVARPSEHTSRPTNAPDHVIR